MKTLDADFFISDLNGCCGDIDSDVFEGKKVLVTGASGLIGTYLCAYFVSLKQRGVALDLYAVTRNELSAHLSDLIQLGNVKHLRINLNDVREYDKLPDVDYAIHAAGYAQPTVFMNNPADTLAVNVSATMAILKGNVRARQLVLHIERKAFMRVQPDWGIFMAQEHGLAIRERLIHLLSKR